MDGSWLVCVVGRAMALTDTVPAILHSQKNLSTLPSTSKWIPCFTVWKDSVGQVIPQLGRVVQTGWCPVINGSSRYFGHQAGRPQSHRRHDRWQLWSLASTTAALIYRLEKCKAAKVVGMGSGAFVRT